MSKKRPTESSWDSDEELLNDTSGNAISAFPKELDLLGEGDLDEDALLGLDEIANKNFSHDSVWSVSNRHRSKHVLGHQTSHAEARSVVDEQAFVFEEADTGDLEDELNVAGPEGDAPGFHGAMEEDYSGNLYHQGDDSVEVDGSATSDARHVDYTSGRMNDSADAEQSGYDDERRAEFGDASSHQGYLGREVRNVNEDSTGVELEYDNPAEQDSQVHLEYGESQTGHQDDQYEAKSDNFETESDSDDEDSRHNRGKFTSERTGVISLTSAAAREAIPDTLEINEEQAAQIEQFMTDKSHLPKGRERIQSRLSARNRLGSKTSMGPQKNVKMFQGPRMPQFPRGGGNQFPRGGSNQFPRGSGNQGGGNQGGNMRMNFPFPRGPLNRSLLSLGMLNSQGPMQPKFFNQRGPFPGAQNQRQPLLPGAGGVRNLFAGGPLNIMFGGPPRGLMPLPQPGFAGPSNQRGPFPGAPHLQRPQRMQQQSIRPPQQQRPPQPMLGPPSNQMRPMGSFNQRMTNPGQFGQQAPPLMGRQGSRPMSSGQGPRPLLGRNDQGMGFARSNRPTTAGQGGQPIPLLIRNVSAGQGTQPGSAGQRLGEPRRLTPHQRLGPVPSQNRFQNPNGQMSSPSGPFQTSPTGPGFQQPPQFGSGGQSGMAALRKHKIYINPRFQNQGQNATGITRTVKMGQPIQQKKAKVLLDRAILTQKKQQSLVTINLVGAKRKSTGEEAVPSKIIRSEAGPKPVTDVKSTTDGSKSDTVTKSESEDVEMSSSRVVEVSDSGKEPTDEEAKKIKALLEEQKRKREIIQKKKELARQKQAAIKRIELERRLKEEGKTLDDVIGGKKEESTEVKEDVKEVKEEVAPVKSTSGSLASRLGPPPATQSAQPQAPAPRVDQQNIKPFTQVGSAGYQSRQFSGAPKSSPQSFQSRAAAYKPGQTAQSIRPHDPRPRGPAPNTGTRLVASAPGSANTFRGSTPTGSLRMRAPPPSTNTRFQGTSTGNQFRTSHSMYETRYQAPASSQNSVLKAPISLNDLRNRPPPQVHSQTYPGADQAPRYTAPPPATPQTVRFQMSQSGPPPQQVSQTFQPRYPPASAPPTHPPSQYPPPSQATPLSYTSTAPPPYPPPARNYQPAPAYQAAEAHQYQQPPPNYPPPAPAINPSPVSQYQQLTATQHYQTPAATQYQPAPAQPQYQAPPPQPQPQYQMPQVQHQYAPSITSAQYQAPQVQSHYQAPAHQMYQAAAATYTTTASDPYYGEATTSYYSQPQPIQTVTSQTIAPAAAVGDQRTVQHNLTLGQRIQTISQRVQPVSGTQMHSIIHNVVSQASQSTSARQAPAHSSEGGRAVTSDKQVHVLDGPQKILIQNVPPVATKETLIKICRHFGQVLGISLIPEQNKAVVQFQKGEQAAKCVAKCNQKCLHKTRLTVSLLTS